MDNLLRVALPLGIGDCWWVCQKLGALAKLEGKGIHAYVNSSPNHASVAFLKLIPDIKEASFSAEAPYDIKRELPPSYRDPKWSTLEGARNWNGFDYVLVSNGHLEEGKRIETWLPDLETKYEANLVIPPSEEIEGLELCGPNRIVLYPSGMGPNRGFHNNTWTVLDWAEVIKQLNKAGHVPVLVGAKTPDDMRYRDNLLKLGNLQVVDTIGHTNIPKVMAIIRSAKVWCGLNSGLGIVSSSMGVPTVMLWSDANYKINGVNVYLHPNMKTSWLSPEQLNTYRTFSFGSQELTPNNVTNEILGLL